MYNQEKHLELNKSIINGIEELNECKYYCNKKAKLLQDQISLNNAYRQTVAELAQEEKDVAQLEGLTLSSLYHTIKKDKQETLSKEEQEVIAAKIKVDQIVSQITALGEEIKKAEQFQSKRSELQKKQDALMNQKKEFIAINFGDLWEVISKKTQELSDMDRDLREVEEAVNAGNQATLMIEEIQSELSSAEGWGVYDMLGGGFLATMAKREHMDNSQELIQRLNENLKAFSRELKDVDGSTLEDLHIDEYFALMDYFFDGFFVDFAVQSKIEEAQEKVDELSRQVSSLMNHLQDKKDEGLQQKAKIAQEIDDLVGKA